MDRLKGKVAIVTGSSRGIGRAIAESFATEGARVIATGRAKAVLFNDDIEYQCLDVAEEADWKRVVADVFEKQRRVDVLVNNAGIIAYEPVHDLTIDAWSQVIRTNQTGVWLGMREVIPIMQGQGGGSIVNLSSIWGNVAVPGAHAYHATKGAVRNMTKNAAITYAEHNIRINSIVPGFVMTPLTEAQPADMNAFVVRQTPMGRPGQPQEIANGALFLASDESSFVTGAELVIDGGYLAR